MARLFFLSIALIIAGSFLAQQIQTDGGRVEVSDVRFVGEAGQTMSGLLYVPESATAENPQPGILAVHGYINSRETQSGFAIELAKRGFVVLALDQTGHGYSDPPAFSHGLGGPDGLRYLRGLPMVDTDQIGLEGHSMGGWTVLLTAAAMPDDYQAMVLVGSSTGTFQTPAGTKDFPRNLQLIFGRYDEFSAFMWDAAIPADIVNSKKLTILFDTAAPVIEGQRYGDALAGTARQLSIPGVTHPGEHLSTEAIAQASDWLQAMLPNNRVLVGSQQSWYWKELGTLIALKGLLLLMLTLSHFLLKLPLFKALTLKAAATAAEPTMNTAGSRSWLTLGAVALIPIVTFFPVQAVAALVFPANAIFSQAITNGIVLWLVVNGLISLGGFVLWRRKLDAATALPLQSFKLALGFALLWVSGLYMATLAVDALFLTDFRFWLVAFKLLSAHQWLQFIVYLPLFCGFFIIQELVLHQQLNTGNSSLRASMIRNCLLLAAGFALLLAVQYIPLLLGGTMAIASQPLLTIVAIQFLPLMIIVAALSSWCYSKTHNIYPGALANGLWVCWYVVAGQATQAMPLLSF